MKPNKLLLLTLAVLFISSCDLLNQKNKTEYFDQFDYTLSDDVSPLNITLTAEGEWDQTEWLVDRFYSNKIDNKSADLYFYKPGYYPVKFRGYRNGTNFEGEKTIQIPPKATKIKILGFSFHPSEKVVIFKKQHYKIESAYFNSEFYETKSDDLNITEVTLNDTVFLNEPILFLINGFDDPAKSDHIFINLSIKAEDERFISDYSFYGSFHLNTSYLSDRFLYSGKILLSNTRGKEGINKLYLIVDWMP